MAALKAEIKRGFLRSLWRAAKAGSVSLADALAAFQDQGFNALKSGRLIISTAGEGKSIQFAPPLGQQFAQEEVFALSEEFFAVFESVTGADDDAIFAAMMVDDRLQSITEVRQDFTGIRERAYG